MSTDQNESQLKELALQWKNAAPALRAQRHADIRRQDNAQAIVSLNSLFLEALRQSPPTKISGFVQMYQVFMRQKRAELMRDLVRAAAQVQTVFDRKRWRYCFIGGLAVQKWGQVRITEDIDLTVFTGIGQEAKFIDSLLEHFDARIPNARSFALQNRVLLLATATGVELDVSCGAFPFEQCAVARAKKTAVIPGIKLKLCTAEDLIIYKAFANRPIDWLDIEGIVAKQTAADLDLHYIFKHMQMLVALKEEPEIMPRLRALIHGGSQ